MNLQNSKKSKIHGNKFSSKMSCFIVSSHFVSIKDKKALTIVSSLTPDNPAATATFL